MGVLRTAQDATVPHTFTSTTGQSIDLSGETKAYDRWSANVEGGGQKTVEATSTTGFDWDPGEHEYSLLLPPDDGVGVEVIMSPTKNPSAFTIQVALCDFQLRVPGSTPNCAVLNADEPGAVKLTLDRNHKLARIDFSGTFLSPGASYEASGFAVGQIDLSASQGK